MNRKNDVEVMINDKKYVLCGYESAEYLEKIASYINKKVSALKEEDGYRLLDGDMKNVLLQINLVDDYYKLVQQISEMEQDRIATNRELFDLKHEVMKKQTELDQLQQQMEQLKELYHEANIRMP